MAELLKNVYTQNYLLNLANKIKEQYENFETENFLVAIFDETWESLELKDRMRHIAIKLNDFLPLSYKKQLEILKLASKSFFSYDAMFFQDFVEVYGLRNFDDSIKALEVFTINSSSEFAIRQFILKYEDKTMAQMKKWAKSKNEHLRRLSSEGCRPRLPWAIALSLYKKNPTKVFEILELLKNDQSIYVQKSVANNLNDISKDNKELVINFVKENLGKNKSLDWICKHGSRTLLKKGDKEVLKLFGFLDVSHIKIDNFKIEKSVNIGKDLFFSFDLNSKNKLGNIRVEYAIDYLKANGTHSRKIFMLLQNDVGKRLKNFVKKQSFKNMTTRKHYLGHHILTIIINGKEYISKDFEVKE